MNAVLHTFRNEADGVEGRVAKREDGKFAVTLFDIDAAKTFPVVHIYDDEARAIAAAQSVAGLLS